MSSRNQREDWSYGGGRPRDNAAGPSSQSDECNDDCPEDPQLITAELTHQRLDLNRSRSQQAPAAQPGQKRLNPTKCLKPGEPRPSSSQGPCRTDSDGKLVCDRGTETGPCYEGGGSESQCRCGPTSDPLSQRDNQMYSPQPYATSESFAPPRGMAASSPSNRQQFTPSRGQPASPCPPVEDWDVSALSVQDRDLAESPLVQVRQTDESFIFTVPPSRPGENSVQVVISKPNRNMTYTVPPPFDADLSGIYPLDGHARHHHESTPLNQGHMSSRAGADASLGERSWNFAPHPPENSDFYDDYRDNSIRNRQTDFGSSTASSGRAPPVWPYDDLSNLFPDDQSTSSRRSERAEPKAPRNMPENRRQNASFPQRAAGPSNSRPAPGGRPGGSWPYYSKPPLGGQGRGNRTPQNLSQPSANVSDNLSQGPWPYPMTPLDELSNLFPSEEDTSTTQRDNQRAQTSKGPSGGPSKKQTSFK